MTHHVFMSNRHLARTMVMQILFTWDFNGKNKDANFEELIRNDFEKMSDDSSAQKTGFNFYPPFQGGFVGVSHTKPVFGASLKPPLKSLRQLAERNN